MCLRCAERCENADEHAVLLEMIKRLEGIVASGDLVPSLERMCQFVASGEARRNVACVAVLQSIVAASAAIGMASLTGDLADVRDLVWACGQLTNTTFSCTPTWMRFHVPSGVPASEITVQDLIQVLGLRVAIALWLYRPDGEAYQAERFAASWVSLIRYLVKETLDCRGLPGGLGAAGETKEVALKEGLLDWNPSATWGMFVAELRAWKKLRRSGKDCGALAVIVFDVTTACSLGPILEAMPTETSLAGSKQGLLIAEVVALTHHESVVTLAGSRLGVAHRFAPHFVVEGIVAFGVWSITEESLSVFLRSAGLRDLAFPECIGDLLGSATYTNAMVSSPFTPTAEDVGFGYNLCTAGLGQCPTDKVTLESLYVDMLVGSLEPELSSMRRESEGLDKYAKWTSGAISECRRKVGDIYCELWYFHLKTMVVCDAPCEGRHFLPSGERLEGDDGSSA